VKKVAKKTVEVKLLLMVLYGFIISILMTVGCKLGSGVK